MSRAIQNLADLNDDRKSFGRDCVDLGDQLLLSSAPSIDDPQTLHRAHCWIEEECPGVAGDDRYVVAPGVAAKVRNGFGSITEAEARKLCQFWSDLCCDP